EPGPARFRWKAGRWRARSALRRLLRSYSSLQGRSRSGKARHVFLGEALVFGGREHLGEGGLRRADRALHRFTHELLAHGLELLLDHDARVALHAFPPLARFGEHASALGLAGDLHLLLDALDLLVDARELLLVARELLLGFTPHLRGLVHAAEQRFLAPLEPFGDRAPEDPEEDEVEDGRVDDERADGHRHVRRSIEEARLRALAGAE